MEEIPINILHISNLLYVCNTTDLSWVTFCEQIEQMALDSKD